ncbi:MAG: hypothetical protein E6H69_06570, partial [Betaproteobacteria bacterium]
DHQIVGRVPQVSPFCPNIAATPDGEQVWLTLKDVGQVMVFGARPPFSVLKTLDTGPITNHVNFARNARGTFAYVTVGGRNEVQAFRTDDFSKAATIPVGKLPHGIWPSGDGSRVYVGLENEDRLAAIDTLTNTVIATIPIGQAAQAVNYVPNAVPEGAGTQGLQALGLAGQATHLSLLPVTRGQRTTANNPPTSVSLFDQTYVLALAQRPDGSGVLEPLAAFTTNPAGSAIVNAVGPIRQVVQGEDRVQRRYLVIAPATSDQLGTPVQIQAQ